MFVFLLIKLKKINMLVLEHAMKIWGENMALRILIITHLLNFI